MQLFINRVQDFAGQTVVIYLYLNIHGNNLGTTYIYLLEEFLCLKENILTLVYRYVIAIIDVQKL